MKIRSKILLYFSSLSICIVGIIFIVIYNLFSNYRVEEFQQRIKEKTITTVKFMVEVEKIDYSLLQNLDKYTINNLFKEKTLIFDDTKKLLYSSVDDTKIKFEKHILDELNAENSLIELTEDDFDVVGVFFEFDNKNYYGISKAYDEVGISKLNYLKTILIAMFIAFSSITLIASYLVSRQISQPLNLIASEINDISFDAQNKLITIPDSKDEIHILATRFNDLMLRLNESFSYQKHVTHHISHELKTPIAILVSNFERIEREEDTGKLKQLIIEQKEQTKNLSNIINALLEISKVEAGQDVKREDIRIDELIFDIVEEFKNLDPDFTFELNFDDTISNEHFLTVKGNKRLLRLGLINIASNCIKYSSNKRADFLLSMINDKLCINIINKGETIDEKEQQYLFQHFFRGANSKTKNGFGLGLVLVNRIINLHNGTISYSNSNQENVFSVKLPIKR